MLFCLICICPISPFFNVFLTQNNELQFSFNVIITCNKIQYIVNYKQLQCILIFLFSYNKLCLIIIVFKKSNYLFFYFFISFCILFFSFHFLHISLFRFVFVDIVLNVIITCNKIQYIVNYKQLQCILIFLFSYNKLCLITMTSIRWGTFSFHFLHISLFRFVFVGFVLFRFHFVDFVSFRFAFVDFVSYASVQYLLF
jgi:hypothetical protein